ncbi:MAG TPA: RMD1 family protein [Stellaceae bacterium]|jgi:uncharacterized Rmd1/YagE family protein|nr:RMD1 family protein [Stellaceae bacterium]
MATTSSLGTLSRHGNVDWRPASPSALPSTVRIKALLLGGRIETRGLVGEDRTGSPLMLRLEPSGSAFIFRYGAVVFCNAEPAAEAALLASLATRTSDRLEVPEIEETLLKVQPELDDLTAAGGAISLRDTAAERLQIVAHVLAKSLVLAHYEAKISSVFDQIDPLAEQLMRKGRTGGRIRDLLQKIGYVLLTQQRMVGRVEIDEKPDALWDHPELERLYARLEDEYELRERSRVIERKLDLVENTVSSLLELVQDKRSTRLEWYIIVLIIIEIALSGFGISQHLLVG